MERPRLQGTPAGRPPWCVDPKAPGADLPPGISLTVLEETPTNRYLVLPPRPEMLAGLQVGDAELAGGGGCSLSICCVGGAGNKCWNEPGHPNPKDCCGRRHFGSGRRSRHRLPVAIAARAAETGAYGRIFCSLPPPCRSGSLPALPAVGRRQLQARLACPEQASTTLGVRVQPFRENPRGWRRPALTQTEKLAQLLDLVVAPACRGAGFGAGLLSQLESALQGQGCVALAATHPCDEYTPALGNAAAKVWLAATLHLPPALSGGVKAIVDEAPWMQQVLPAGCTVFPWLELTAADRQGIPGKATAGGVVHARSSPFQFGPAAESDDQPGVALYHLGRVIGWASILPQPQRICSTIFCSSAQRRVARAGQRASGDTIRRQYAAGRGRVVAVPGTHQCAYAGSSCSRAGAGAVDHDPDPKSATL